MRVRLLVVDGVGRDVESVDVEAEKCPGCDCFRLRYVNSLNLYMCTGFARKMLGTTCPGQALPDPDQRFLWDEEKKGWEPNPILEVMES